MIGKNRLYSARADLNSTTERWNEKNSTDELWIRSGQNTSKEVTRKIMSFSTSYISTEENFSLVKSIERIVFRLNLLIK